MAAQLLQIVWKIAVSETSEMKRSGLHIAVFLVALSTMSSSAWADSLSNVFVDGWIWNVAGNMVNAREPGTTDTFVGHFTAPQINFSTPGPQNLNGATTLVFDQNTLRAFLANGNATRDAGTVNSTTLTGFDTSRLDLLMSNCITGSVSCPSSPTPYSTIIKLTGNTTFHGGTTYSLWHDDGVLMYAGGSTSPVIGSAAPTSADYPSTWTPASDVSGPFTIYYSATNGNPELLRLEGVVPDGGMTLMLLGGALVGIESLRRRFRA